MRKGLLTLALTGVRSQTRKRSGATSPRDWSHLRDLPARAKNRVCASTWVRVNPSGAGVCRLAQTPRSPTKCSWPRCAKCHTRT